MSKFYSILFAICILFTCQSISKAEEPSTEFSVTLSQDPSFGFYPSFSGSIGLNESTKFTVYGVYWTQDALAGNAGGLNLLTEFGAGVSFSMLDGSLNINPSLGFAHGNYQSGGGRAVIADNIVPSVLLAYEKDNFFLNFGAIYWKGLRKEAKITPLIDLIDYNFNTGINISKYFSVGLFYDHFFTAEDYSYISPSGKKETNTTYLWVGPMIGINFKDNASVMFSFGADFVDQFNDDIPSDNKKIKDFYKLSTTIGF